MLLAEELFGWQHPSLHCPASTCICRSPMGHWRQKKSNFICGFLSPERNKCKGQYLVHFAACPRDSIWTITEKRATEKGRTSCLHKGLHELGAQVNSPRQNWRKGILSFLQITAWLQCENKNAEQPRDVWYAGDFADLRASQESVLYREAEFPQRPLESTLLSAALNKQT